MKLPRDINGVQLATALRKLGYQIDRQTGSHIRLTTQIPSEHHVTIPAHNPLTIGTLSSILRAVGEHVGQDRDQLLNTLFG